MSLGLNVSNLGVGGGGGPISVGATLQINGLTGGIAVIGDHASLTLSMSDASTILSQTWGSTPGGTEYGTGASPTDYTAGDGGTLYATATTAAGTFSRSAAIRYAAAVNTVAPVASGSTSLGDVLSTTNGTWTGAVGGSFSYQWQRDGVDISGATSSSYMIVAADDAAAVRCVVTYTNSGGAVSANSNAITVDDFAIPVISGVPTISGTEEVGQTLTATAASVTGNPTPVRTWQWENNGTPISGATSSTYVLQASDEGDTITVVQTETNGIGADSAESAATGTIAAASDTTAPVVSNHVWNDGPGTGSFDLDEGGTMYLVTYNSGSGTPDKDGSGGWTGTTLETFSQAVTTGSNNVNFNETGASATATHYAFYVRDAAGNDSTVTTQAYTHDITGPTISSSDPADNSTDHPIADNIVITFSENIALGTGNIVLRENNGGWADLATYDVTSASEVSVATNQLTINPASDLTAGREYAIRIAATAIDDARGNSFAGITDDTTLSFTAASAAAYSDDFTRGSDEELSAGSEWENQGGTTGVHDVIASSDRLESSPSGAGSCHDTVTTAAYSSAADTAVSVDMLAKTGSGESLTGPLIRSSSSTTGYCLNIDPDQNSGDGMIRILDLSDFSVVGTATTFTAESVSLPFTATIKAVGSTISAEIDGVEVISATDATHSSGQPGIYTLYIDGTANQPMDNFTVEEV